MDSLWQELEVRASSLPCRQLIIELRGPRGWQPLPYIHSGFVVHPYHPLPPASTPRTPLFNPAAEEEGTLRQSHDFASTAATANPYEIPLDIGDEFFAFEEYKCSLEEDGRGDVWFRGCVVMCARVIEGAC